MGLRLQWHHNNKGKWGGVNTTSATPDMQTPCAAHFPPIRSRRCSCPMSLPSHSLLDTFVLWLDRCRGSAVKCARREPTTSITDKERSGCEHPHHTHFQGEGEKNVTEKRDDEELFLYIYIYWMGAAGKFTTRDKRPKTMISPPWPCSLLAQNNKSKIKLFLSRVFSPWPRTIELLLHHSEINYCC